MNLEKNIRENNCIIVEMCAQEEYCCGNITGSINIPLKEIHERL